MKMRPLRALELVCRLGRATNTMWALLGLSHTSCSVSPPSSNHPQIEVPPLDCFALKGPEKQKLF